MSECVFNQQCIHIQLLSQHLHYIVSHLQLVNPSVDPTALPPLTLRYQEKEASEHLGYLPNERNYHWLLTRGLLTDVISTFILSSSFSSLFNCLDSLWNLAVPSNKEESRPSCELLIVVLEPVLVVKQALWYCCVWVCGWVCMHVRVCVCVCRGGGQWGMPFEQQVVIETKQGLIREASGNSWSKQRAAEEPKHKSPGIKWSSSN